MVGVVGLYLDKGAAASSHTHECYVWGKVGEVSQVDVMVARDLVNLSPDQKELEDIKNMEIGCLLWI